MQLNLTRSNYNLKLAIIGVIVFDDFFTWIGYSAWWPHSTFVDLDQCDLIGEILKSLGNKFVLKISPNCFLTFELFWKRSLYAKTTLDIIFATFLIQHLVTLILTITITVTRCLNEKVAQIFPRVAKKVATVVFAKKWMCIKIAQKVVK